MRATFVLLHSPALGPRSWQAVATTLGAAGHQVAVPSLLNIAQGEPPYWPRFADAVHEELREVAPGSPVILVPHSNAGFFVPTLVDDLQAKVRGCVFVDAALPAQANETPVVPAGAMPFLREKATGGVLPPWTEWWDDEDVRALFPDESTRQAVTAEQPRLSLAYFEQSVPVPTGWDDRPCAYLQFSRPYNADADNARQRGWTVQHLPSEHLHMLIDPAGVAQSLITIADQDGMTSP